MSVYSKVIAEERERERQRQGDHQQHQQKKKTRPRSFLFESHLFEFSAG